MQANGGMCSRVLVPRMVWSWSLASLSSREAFGRPSVTHQRAGARRVDFRIDPNAGVCRMPLLPEVLDDHLAVSNR